MYTKFGEKTRPTLLEAAVKVMNMYHDLFTYNQRMSVCEKWLRESISYLIVPWKNMSTLKSAFIGKRKRNFSMNFAERANCKNNNQALELTCFLNLPVAHNLRKLGE